MRLTPVELGGARRATQLLTGQMFWVRVYDIAQDQVLQATAAPWRELTAWGKAHERRRPPRGGIMWPLRVMTIDGHESVVMSTPSVTGFAFPSGWNYNAPNFPDQ